MSAIEWTDETWNPVTGCKRVSEGCENCYAIPLAWRMMHHGNPDVAERYAGTVRKLRAGPRIGELDWTGEINLLYGTLGKPLTWKKPRMVFVNSMSDLFHSKVPTDFIRRVWSVMSQTPRHTYQILTKRPARMAKYTRAELEKPRLINCAWYSGTGVLPNVWLGTSVEDKSALHRLDALRRAQAAVRFVSFEPLLGPLGRVDLSGIDWAIVGCESGPRARYCDIGWVEDLVARCREQGVKVFIKQLMLDDGSGAREEIVRDIDKFPEHLRIREYPDGR